jgi:hypothetical protein
MRMSKLICHNIKENFFNYRIFAARNVKLLPNFKNATKHVFGEEVKQVTMKNSNSTAEDING